MSQDNRNVAEKMGSLPLLTLDDLYSRFPNIPIKMMEVEEDFHKSLRLVTTSHCTMHCQYPTEGRMWCHNEGVARNGLPPADMDTMLRVVKYFYERYGTDRITLAGLQPILNDELLDFIVNCRRAGIRKVSFTSHGLGVLEWLERLQNAGMTDITLSVQSFTKDSYKSIMGKDGLENAIQVIEKARALGLPVAVNRVLLKGFTNDIAEVLDWIQEQDLRVRFYDIMWQPGHDNLFEQYFVSWQELLAEWEDHIRDLDVWYYKTSGRINMVANLRKGGSVETNLPVPPLKAGAPECQTCPIADQCTEGYLGCGIRITPDARISPCLLRPDLSRSLLPLLDLGALDEAGAVVDQLLDGSVVSQEEWILRCTR